MVQILDSTLREGEQTPGVYFQPYSKLPIADYLDKVGVDIIEAGHPTVSQNTFKSVKQIANRNLNAIVGAHARSLKEDVDMAIECGVGFLGIFYCVSDDRLNNVFQKSLPKAIDQITKVIDYAKTQDPKLIIRYTPEDTVRSKIENVIEASVEAVRAGADIISVADTTGYMIPGKRSMYDFVRRLKEELASKDAYPKIAVHCHDDRGLALANALDGYMAGADIIDATVLKLGERAGLVDLATLMAVLNEDFNEENNWALGNLSGLYNIVSRYAGISGIPIPVNHPVTGKNAFTHCAGLHTSAATVNPLHYQSLDPKPFNRKMDVSLDHMSGLASIRWAFKEIGVDWNHNIAIEVLKEVKLIGETGRTVNLEEELADIVELCEVREEERKLNHVLHYSRE